MSQKDEFIEAFKKGDNGRHPKEYLDKKDFKGFCHVVNANEKLREIYKEALQEAEAEKNDPAVGLSNLFGPQ